MIDVSKRMAAELVDALYPPRFYHVEGDGATHTFLCVRCHCPDAPPLKAVYEPVPLEQVRRMIGGQ